MTICVDTVQKYGLDDYRTPVFVFERLSSIVYPEANDIGEFFLALEKDPQQEDFLQGSLMSGFPPDRICIGQSIPAMSRRVRQSPVLSFHEIDCLDFLYYPRPVRVSCP